MKDRDLVVAAGKRRQHPNGRQRQVMTRNLVPGMRECNRSFLFGQAAATSFWYHCSTSMAVSESVATCKDGRRPAASVTPYF
jgi:hypothetical protein